MLSMVLSSRAVALGLLLLMINLSLSEAFSSAAPQLLSARLRSQLSRSPVRASPIALRMEGEKKKKSSSIAKSIGEGLAGMSKAMDEFEQELEEEDDDDRSSIQKRQDKMMAAADADGSLAQADDLPPIPNPILFANEDFEKSVWKVQVEKVGNWFTGNYLPEEFLIAFTDAEDGQVEFAKDGRAFTSFTKGRWYTDGSCVVFDRCPFAAVGPLGPGQQYFRASLTAWANDNNQLQCAGYVTGYSPLFPISILGKFLMTKEKKVSSEEIEERIKFSAIELGLVDPPKAELPESKPAAKMLDLSEELTEEEQLRKEAAEWTPSTWKEPSAGDTNEKMTKSLERLQGSVKEIGGKYMEEDFWKD